MCKISVLMSIYDEPVRYIDVAVKSILRQSFADFEFIIVVDNPSRMEIIEYLTTLQLVDKRIRVIVNNCNMGLALSLNKAIAISKGKYLARIDADDSAYSNRLESQVKLMENEHLDLVSSSAYLIDSEGIRIGEIVAEYDCSQVIELLPIQNIIIHPSVMIRADIVIKNKGYNPYPCSQDYDLWLRLLHDGARIKVSGERLIEFRQHEESVSNRKRYVGIMTDEYIRRNFKTNRNRISIPFCYEEFCMYLNRIILEDEVVLDENRLLAKYRKGIEDIKNGNIISGMIGMAGSIKSRACRISARTSLKAHIIKNMHRLKSNRL